MGKLRHIAFISAEPKKLSDFYQKYFDFEECKVFPSGSRMVIDPLFNLAFLKSRGDEAGAVVGTHRADGAEVERHSGIHHYGFMVDDLNKAVAKLALGIADEPGRIVGFIGDGSARDDDANIGGKPFGDQEQVFELFARSKCARYTCQQPVAQLVLAAKRAAQ